MKLRIAVVQFGTKPFATDDNLRRAEQFIEEGALAGTQLIVFPEDFLTGPISDRLDLADHEGRFKGFFQYFTKKYAVDLVAGSVIEREGDRFFNTSYYIDSNGETLARYRKINLWLSEKAWCTPGKDVVVTPTRWGMLGLAICWDLAFPEVFRQMFRQGVEIIICPSLWCYEDAGSGIQYNPKSEEVFVNSLCAARAFENEAIVLFCNVAGSFESTKGSRKSIGSSQISIPFMGPTAILRHNREEMLIHEVDTDILKEAEDAYQIRQDLIRKK